MSSTDALCSNVACFDQPNWETTNFMVDENFGAQCNE